jgi:transposase
MAKFKAYDYRQRVFLPVSLEDQLMPGTLGFAIHTLVETRLDTSAFEQKYRNDETGRTAYDPKILLKIVLLGYARGLISSRKIEQACRENVGFIALAAGQQPEHGSIATFVSSMKEDRQFGQGQEWSRPDLRNVEPIWITEVFGRLTNFYS